MEQDSAGELVVGLAVAPLTIQPWVRGWPGDAADLVWTRAEPVFLLGTWPGGFFFGKVTRLRLAPGRHVVQNLHKMHPPTHIPNKNGRK